MPIITVGHFEIFKEECLKWINFFGLKGWKVVFGHYRIEQQTLANCRKNLVGRVATITLNKVWPSHVLASDCEIKRCAFHEVIELFLARIDILASSRYVTESEVNEAIHEIVRTLENVVFDNSYKNEIR